jgi:hypothetical protein
MNNDLANQISRFDFQLEKITPIQSSTLRNETNQLEPASSEMSRVQKPVQLEIIPIKSKKHIGFNKLETNVLDLKIVNPFNKYSKDAGFSLPSPGEAKSINLDSD